MIIVRVDVQSERVDDFVELATFNAAHSRKEPGNLRFDVVRSVATPTKFALYEVYKDESALNAHMQTAHYLRWRAEVADLLSEPRVSERFVSLFPEPYS